MQSTHTSASSLSILGSERDDPKVSCKVLNCDL
jgi:hypothetical protein